MAAAIRSITGSSTQVKTLVDEVHLGSQKQARGKPCGRWWSG